MCPVSVPDLGTNATCFPQLLAGRLVLLVNWSGREGGQRCSRAWSGGLAVVPSSASPAANSGPHHGDHMTSTGRKQTQEDLMPHLPRLHLPHNSPHPTLPAQCICKRETPNTHK